MSHKRTNFTKKQKAEIFARDSGTCAFSGISVWLFDYGIRPNYEIDWADHIIPSAKGGSSDLCNGICASSFYNAKKKDNGSDNKFLFHHGQLTETYIRVHGKASSKLMSDLKRRKLLSPIDWYVNRAVANTFFAFDWRCELEFNGNEYKRDDEYYYRVAFNMLENKIKDKSYSSIEGRGMIDTIRPFDIEKLLEIESICTTEEYFEWAENLWPTYRLNWMIYSEFLSEQCSSRKHQLLERHSATRHVNPEVVEGLRQLLVHDDMGEKLAA